MPVREKAVELLARRVLPGVWFSYGEPSDPRWPTVWREQEETFEALVRSIDWERVLIEAQGRHLAFQHGEQDGPEKHRLDNVEAPCGECVREALLANDHSPNWKDQAAAARAEGGE